jgi:hypothetical protein
MYEKAAHGSIHGAEGEGCAVKLGLRRKHPTTKTQMVKWRSHCRLIVTREAGGVKTTEIDMDMRRVWLHFGPV